MNNANFSKQSSGLKNNKGNPDTHIYPQGTYIDLAPSQQCEKQTASDEHLQKSANSNLNSINITPNDKYPTMNPNSDYSFKQHDENDQYMQHKHKTEQKACLDVY